MSVSCSVDGACGDYEDKASIIGSVTPQDPETLNQQLSFPYPKSGGAVRPAGQGCLSCVHNKYCPALYWYKRNTDYRPTNYTGRNCMSWSNDDNDIVRTISDFDLAENARRDCEGILTEPNRNGITSPTTGSSHK